MKSGSVATTRILVVEDHEPFRKFVRTFLGQLEDFQLVGEAGDGLTAVRKCVELQPDLVLLDIGLPELNGIQAARQIRQLAPGSRIVFLTQESSSAIVHEALSLGAAAYVIKAHTASDLIIAIIAARDGRQFVSAGLDGSLRLNEPPLIVARDTDFSSQASASPHHKVHFYPDDSSFVTGISAFIQRSLKAGKVVLAVTNESRRNAIIPAVEAGGIDTGSSIAAGRLILQDSPAFLKEIMTDDRIDSELLLRLSSELIETMIRANPGSRICACGDCASPLLEQGNVEGAMQIERVWNELSTRYDMELFCGYIFSGFQRAADMPGYRDVCAVHSHVISY